MNLDEACKGYDEATQDLWLLRRRCANRGERLEMLREALPPGTWQMLCDSMHVDDWFDDNGDAL